MGLTWSNGRGMLGSSAAGSRKRCYSPKGKSDYLDAFNLPTSRSRPRRSATRVLSVFVVDTTTLPFSSPLSCDQLLYRFCFLLLLLHILFFTPSLSLSLPLDLNSTRTKPDLLGFAFRDGDCLRSPVHRHHIARCGFFFLFTSSFPLLGFREFLLCWSWFCDFWVNSPVYCVSVSWFAEFWIWR